MKCFDFRVIIVPIIFILANYAAGCFAQQLSPSTLVLYSKIQTIDGIYHSMSGPQDNEPFYFLKNEKPQLLWLTGFKIEVIDPKTKAVLSPEYLCHSHVRFNSNYFDLHKPNIYLGHGLIHPIKLVTLIQGRTEINFPAGFAIPIISNEPFIFHSMVINNNRIDKPFELQVKITFSFFKDHALTSPMKPLFRRCLTERVPLDATTKSKPRLLCLCQLGNGEDREIDDETVETAQPVKSTIDNVSKDSAGKNVVFHWLVPPGRHIYLYKYGHLQLPYDTTINYIAIHLHAYGTFCELRDLTANKTIFKSLATNFKDRIGIEKSEMYSSPVGIPVYKSHIYEMVCGYNNTTSQDVDAMAIMYIYFFNKTFDKNSSFLKTETKG